MGKINIKSISLGLAGLLFIVIVGMIVTGSIDKVGFFILGFFLGYSYAKLFKMSEEDAKTIAIEVGM